MNPWPMINLFSTFQLGQECNMLESIDKQRIQGYFTEELMKGAGGGGSKHRLKHMKHSG